MYPDFLESLQRPWNFLGRGSFTPESAAWEPPPAATFGGGAALGALKGGPLGDLLGLERAADPFSLEGFGIEAALAVDLADPPAGFFNGWSAT